MTTTSRQSARLVMSLVLMTASVTLMACRPEAPSTYPAAASSSAVAPVRAAAPSAVATPSPDASSRNTPVEAPGAASGCETSQTTIFARSRLRADLSVIDGTFDRYVDQPWHAGAFDLRNPGRTMAILKASRAAALDVRLLGTAARNVRAHPTLCKVLLPPIRQLEGSLDRFKAQALAGHFGVMEEAEQSLATVERRAASAQLRLGETTR